MKQYFTDEDLLEVLREGLWYQYLKYPKIRNYLEFEDLVQECALGWYEVMKSTGEVRIEYYRRTMDWKHIRNVVKFCTYQVVPNYLRCNAVKYMPLSLNNVIDDGESEKEFIELIPSLDEDILDSAVDKDILSVLKDEERKIVNDLLAGHTKVSLYEKYSNFDTVLDSARNKILEYFIDSKEDLPDRLKKYLDRLDKYYSYDALPEDYSIEQRDKDFRRIENREKKLKELSQVA